MSVTINAKGTSVPYFRLGKNGVTLYQGSSDPSGSYTIQNGDVWFDTSASTMKIRSSSTWIQPTLDNLTISGSTLSSSSGNDLILDSASGKNVVIDGQKFPNADGSSGQVLSTNGSGVLSWISAGGTGTVTSVAVSGSNGIGVSGSPITTNGTISLSLGAITPTSVAATGTVTGSNLSGTNTGDQTITLTGDITGSGTGSFATTLATVNSSPQSDTFRKITVNGKGLITATSAVGSSDITTALGYTPVNKAGDTMTGNLGIGISPSHRLHVGQTVAAGYATSAFENTDGTGYTQVYFNVGTNGANGRATISYAPGSSGFFAIGPTANDTLTPVVFRTNNATERMRIDNAGNVGIGTASPGFQLDIQGTGGAPMALTRYTNTSSSTSISLQHSRGTSIGSNVIVQSGDILGSILFNGANGTGYDSGASIRGEVDGTPGASNDMPGRLTFWTTSDGSNSLSERLRIDNAGNVMVARVGTSGLGIFQVAGNVDVSNAGSVRTRVRSTDANGAAISLFQNSTSGTTNTDGFEVSLATDGSSASLWNYETGTMLFGTANSERMRIDSSGNVGIGLTPVASNGILQLNSYASVKAILETATVTASAPASTTNFDLITQAVQYYTSNATTNFTLNIRGNSGTSLNTIMQIGQSATLSLLVTNGGTAFRPTAFQIDGNAVTPKWQGGTAPSAGNINSIDIYTLTIIKTASATFTVLATQTQFA